MPQGNELPITGRHVHAALFDFMVIRHRGATFDSNSRLMINIGELLRPRRSIAALTVVVALIAAWIAWGVTVLLY